MANVVFVSLYDQICPGARSIIGTLLEEGHDVSLLHFKKMMTQFFPRGAEESAPELQQGFKYFYVAKPEGNYYFPYPTVVTDEEKELFVDWIEQRGAEVVAFTMLTVFSPLAAELSQRLRRRLPHVKIIWGGIHVWFTAEESLEHCDAACVGEGEGAMKEFLADPNRTDIQNLWFKRDGRIIRNDSRPLMQDMDALPFCVFDHEEYLLENNRVARMTLPEHQAQYRDVYYISTQRGCAYKCSYCSHSMQRDLYKGERYLRRRSHEHVYRELDLRAKTFGLDTVRFLDDIFLIHPPWIQEFCEGYPDRIGLPFGCYCYPIHGVEEMIETAHKAGLKYLNIGVQSGSRYVMRDLFGRKYENDLMQRMCWKAADLGIALVYDVICYNPFENEDHMKETLDFILTLPAPAEMHTFRLNFFPGNKMNTFDKPRFDDIPEKVRLYYALLYHGLRNPGMTPEVVRDLAANPLYREDPEKLAELLTVLIQDAQRQKRLESERDMLRLALQTAQNGNGHGFGGRMRRALNRLRGNGNGNGHAVYEERPLRTTPAPLETGNSMPPISQS